MRHHLPFWESLTNDPFILDAIKHHHIEFEAEYPTQTVQPNKINFSAAEIMTIDAEIAKLITKKFFRSPTVYLMVLFQIFSFVPKRMVLSG